MEQEPSSLDKGTNECSPSGDPRPEYFAPLVSFVKTHMLGEALHLGKSVLFTPSPSSPRLRPRDVSMGKAPPADEMWVGIDPRSVDGKLVLVADEWTGYYCIHVDERSSPPVLKIDMVGASVF